MLIDVILPAYNCDKYILDTLHSIIDQTFGNFKCYVVNDGSTDNTRAVIQSVKDDRIIYVENETNLGLVATLNKAITISSSKYILRIDADDICMPNRFHEQVCFMENHPEIGVCGSNLKTFGKNEIEWNYPEHDDDIRAAVFFRTLMAHPTVIIRRSIIEENNAKYPGDFPHMEDAALWFELIDKTKFHNLQSHLVNYRVEGQNITEKNKATRIEREQAFYTHVFKSFGIDISDELMASYVKRKNAKQIGLNDVDNIMVVYDRLLRWVESTGWCSRAAVNRIIEMELERLYYKACDSGRKVAWRYLKKKPTLNPRKLYYFFRKSLS